MDEQLSKLWGAKLEKPDIRLKFIVKFFSK